MAAIELEALVGCGALFSLLHTGFFSLFNFLGFKLIVLSFKVVFFKGCINNVIISKVESGYTHQLIVGGWEGFSSDFNSSLCIQVEYFKTLFCI